jgi:DNA-binding transcriptional LysR family regulator
VDNLDETKTFLAVADALSFAAAAKKLHISAAQASKLVSRLEDRLGVRLLNRTTRNVSLTDAGTVYAQQARTVVDDFEALELFGRGGAQSLKGILKIAAPVSFATAVLDPILADFARSEPDLTLEVYYSDQTINIVERGYDVAVRVGHMADSSLIAKKLGATRILYVASPKYLASNGPPTKPRELRAHQCIIDLNAHDPFAWDFRSTRGRLIVRVDGRLRFTRAETCLRAARLDLGIARSPAFAAVPELRSKRLIPVLESFEPEPLPVHAVYPHARHLPGKVRTFLDFLTPRLIKILTV